LLIVGGKSKTSKKVTFEDPLDGQLESTLGPSFVIRSLEFADETRDDRTKKRKFSRDKLDVRRKSQHIPGCEFAHSAENMKTRVIENEIARALSGLGCFVEGELNVLALVTFRSASV